jgi:predicted O-methyltransferase YrrM
MPIDDPKLPVSRFRLNWRAIHGWCDFEKIYDDAARQVPPDGVLVEVGTAFGRSAAMMAERLMMRGKRQAAFYCVDTWEEGPHNTLTNHAETEALLAKLGGAFTAFATMMLVNAPEALKIVRPIRAPSVMAARMFELESIDFVFLDGAHDEGSVMDDLMAWAPKVKPGGTIAGHDYTDPEYPGVKKAVDWFVQTLREEAPFALKASPPRGCDFRDAPMTIDELKRLSVLRGGREVLPGFGELDLVGSSWRIRRLP